MSFQTFSKTSCRVLSESCLPWSGVEDWERDEGETSAADREVPRANARKTNNGRAFFLKTLTDKRVPFIALGMPPCARIIGSRTQICTSKLRWKRQRVSALGSAARRASLRRDLFEPDRSSSRVETL